MSILLVEDNEMNTLLASAILQRIGANITEADNGMEAVNLLRKREFDIVLMDLHLPVMNGFETTRYIRNTLHMDVPVIAITANVINGGRAAGTPGAPARRGCCGRSPRGSAGGHP